MVQWLRIHLAMKGYGLNPWSGKILHAVEQLSLCATTTKPVLQSPGATATEACEPTEACQPSVVLSNKRSHCSEKPRPRNWRVDPLTSTRENPSSDKVAAQPKTNVMNEF